MARNQGVRKDNSGMLARTCGRREATPERFEIRMIVGILMAGGGGGSAVSKIGSLLASEELDPVPSLLAKEVNSGISELRIIYDSKAWDSVLGPEQPGLC